MADIQAKVGEGFSKFQNNLEVSKQVQQLKKKQQVLTQTKAEQLIKLGEACYRDIRRSPDVVEEYQEMTEILIEADQELYELGLKMEELQADVETKCSCGAPVSSSDKFCGSCGAKVEIIEKDVLTEVKSCETCSTENKTENDYCICCGQHFVKVISA
ncbi:zinc ribbon domain-containing protein [Alkalicoccus daliensis]|uniref:DZANK-type domain-containing protein n=1 Tax=Alkalicoccus daliensis TaxID=745820 RepID=A0A1H0GBL6_9BACI|nr:zinc ribbon domain-containing protein [Alkalicoccus daliensis]SDO04234.1 hypothetical protein SAMN04488053_10646 [Alkalicoccus daliensis]